MVTITDLLQPDTSVEGRHGAFQFLISLVTGQVRMQTICNQQVKAINFTYVDYSEKTILWILAKFKIFL